MDNETTQLFLYVVTSSGRDLHFDLCARAAQRACESLERLQGCTAEIECRVYHSAAPVCVGGLSP